jgi:hypothetical protein
VSAEQLERVTRLRYLLQLLVHQLQGTDYVTTEAWEALRDLQSLLEDEQSRLELEV